MKKLTHTVDKYKYPNVADVIILPPANAANVLHNAKMNFLFVKKYVMIVLDYG